MKVDTDTSRRVYTVQEIQSILGLGKNKTYKLCTSGLFKHIRIGKSIIIPKESFLNWLNEDNINEGLI